MKKLFTILFCLIGLASFGQTPLKTKQITADTARIKKLTVDPVLLTGYGTLFNKNDSLHFESPVKDWNLGKIVYQDSLGYYVMRSDSTTMFVTPSQLTDSLNIVRDTLAKHTDTLELHRVQIAGKQPAGDYATNTQLGAKLDTTLAPYITRMNWPISYADRLKWDGGTGTWFNAVNGRSALGLGDMALETKSRYRLQTDHDSLSTLDEKSYNSLDNKPDLTVYAGKDTLALYRKLANHDSLSALDERSYNSLTDKPDLTVLASKDTLAYYRKLTNHDSLSTLDEKSYTSLTDKPDLSQYATNTALGAKLDTMKATYTDRLHWNTAYTDRLKWDGGSTGLVQSTALTSLGLSVGATLLPAGTTGNLLWHNGTAWVPSTGLSTDGTNIGIGVSGFQEASLDIKRASGISNLQLQSPNGLNKWMLQADANYENDGYFGIFDNYGLCFCRVASPIYIIYLKT